MSSSTSAWAHRPSAAGTRCCSNDTDRRTIYISEGLAHGFLALEDNSTIMYLCSSEYNPQREHTISAMDPTLAIDWPMIDGVALSLSDRDAAAPTFEEVRASGVLPTWDETQAFIGGMRERRELLIATGAAADHRGRGGLLRRQQSRRPVVERARRPAQHRVRVPRPPHPTPAPLPPANRRSPSAVSPRTSVARWCAR